MTEQAVKTINRKTLQGVVVSTKMKDTVVVAVDRYVKHPKYGKYLRKTKKYKAHNPGNTVGMGAKVEIIETRPISKDKHFAVSEVLKAGTVIDIEPAEAEMAA